MNRWVAEMRTCIFLSVVALSHITAATGLADSWGPIKKTEFYSANRKHLLKISPHANWSKKPGHCRATLYTVEDAECTEVWSRFLINNQAPVRVFVSDSGDYVLTMDEWGSLGELPVVIYGWRGGLVRVHSTDSLGLENDVRHITMSVSSYWWNEDSMSFFGPDEETFFIRLHWGKLLLLSLDDGDLMNDEWYGRHKGWHIPEERWKTLHDFARREHRERALQWLDSEDSRERKIGAVICGQAKLEEAIPRLRELLTDEEHMLSFRGILPAQGHRVYYVRKAAKEALENMGEDCEDAVVNERTTCPSFPWNRN